MRNHSYRSGQQPGQAATHSGETRPSQWRGECAMTGGIPPLAPGLEARYERMVPLEWTIAHYDARLPAVFSTPAMIGMMEMAAAQAVQPALPGGSITVA